MHFEIYCDESRPELLAKPSTAPGDFSLLGSLWLPADLRQTIKKEITEDRAAHSVWGELKWTKVTSAKVDFYKALTDIFFRYESISFRAIAIKTEKIDLQRHHNNDPELGYYKFYYQLLVHRLASGGNYAVFLDHRKNRLPTRLRSLKTVLTRAKPNSTIDLVQAIPSGESDLLQLCDVLLGVVQGRMNESNRGSLAKMELVNHVENKLGHKIGPTHVSELKFNIFQIWLGP